MNIRELDEESRRTGVWPPRRIILRVEGGATDVEEQERPAPVSVGLVDLATPSRPTVRTAPRPAPAPPPREALAAGQVAPRPPLSRPPAPGSVVRRNGRIVAAPRPTSRLQDEDAEFEQWLAKPLAISESDPDYQPAPLWLPEDRRVRAERRHRRIARRSRAQLLGTGAATSIAAAGCCVALALVLSQTETVGGSLGVPSIGLFGTRPAAPVTPTAEVSRPAVKKPAAKKAVVRKAAKKAKRTTRTSGSARSGSTARANQSASTAQSSTPATTQGSAQTPQRTVAPPPPPPAASTQRAATPKPKTSTPAKSVAPKPAPTPPAASAPSGSPSLGSDGEPSL